MSQFIRQTQEGARSHVSTLEFEHRQHRLSGNRGESQVKDKVKSCCFCVKDPECEGVVESNGTRGRGLNISVSGLVTYLGSHCG